MHGTGGCDSLHNLTQRYVHFCEQVLVVWWPAYIYVAKPCIYNLMPLCEALAV